MCITLSPALIYALTRATGEPAVEVEAAVLLGLTESAPDTSIKISAATTF